MSLICHVGYATWQPEKQQLYQNKQMGHEYLNGFSLTLTRKIVISQSHSKLFSLEIKRVFLYKSTSTNYQFSFRNKEVDIEIINGIANKMVCIHG
jgi:hypothetical protein